MNKKTIAILENEAEHFDEISKAVRSLGFEPENLFMHVKNEVRRKPGVELDGTEGGFFLHYPQLCIEAVQSWVEAHAPYAIILDLALTEEDGTSLEVLANAINIEGKVEDFMRRANELLAFRILKILHREQSFVPCVLFSQHAVNADQIFSRLIDCRADVMFVRKPNGVRAFSAAITPTLKRCVTFSSVVQQNRSLFAQATPENVTLYDRLVQIALSDQPVLISGETGIGKTQIARMLHNLSKRSQEAFKTFDVSVHSSPDLFRSELMGYRKGSFTDAGPDRPGAMLDVANGTAFLDEINSLHPSLQCVLLRLLDTGMLSPTGGEFPQKTAFVGWNGPVHTRFIFAANTSLAAMMHAGTFRRDLYYRLSVHRVELKPLVERRAEIPNLLRHVVAELTAQPVEHDKKRFAPVITARKFTDEEITRAQDYGFPGNIRQMRSVVYRSLSENISLIDALRYEEIDDALAANSPGSASARAQNSGTAPTDLINPADSPRQRVKAQWAETFADFYAKNHFTKLGSFVEEMVTKPFCTEMAKRHKTQERAAEQLGISKITMNRKLHPRAKVDNTHPHGD